jgi:hypothetical protein
MKKLEDLTRNEQSQLLYLETRAVAYSGVVDTRMMNDGDMEIVKKWHEEGFIEFGRICFADRNFGTNYCHLSEEAWALAHALRKERAERGWKNRRWKTTEEFRAEETLKEKPKIIMKPNPKVGLHAMILGDCEECGSPKGIIKHQTGISPGKWTKEKLLCQKCTNRLFTLPTK